MKEIKLSKGLVAFIDDEDFEELNKYKWSASVCKSGNIYATRTSIYIDDCGIRKQKKHIMHRDILKITDSKIFIDHFSGNSLDNRKLNLRKSSRSQNGSNRNKPQRRNSSGFRGVYLDSSYKKIKKWKATIRFNKETINIGRFNSPEDAARAFDAEAKKLFGDFCGKLNFQD